MIFETILSDIAGKAMKAGGQAKVAAAEWIMILLPIILEAVQAFLSQCQSAERFANSCTKISLAHRMAFKSIFVVKLWMARQAYGLTGIRDVVDAARQTCDEIFSGVQEMAGSPEGQVQLTEGFTEFKTAA